MVSAGVHDYGLELTQNSKVGWAFSLSRSESCINATEICERLCYGNGVRYQSDAQRYKRLRNFRTCEFLLKKGGPELLALNLIALVDQARPMDWLAAQISGTATKVPYSLRLHDVGDYPEFRTIPTKSRVSLYVLSYGEWADSGCSAYSA